MPFCASSSLMVPFWLIWAFALAAALAALHLLDSRPGRAIRALKSGTTMAEAMGISTFRYKLTVFVIAAMLAATSGWLFAHFQRTVNPTPFSLAKGIEYLFMAVLGGVGQLAGTVYAALGLGVLNKFLEGWAGAVLAKIAVLVFIIVFIQKRPQGLFALKGRMAEG